MNWLFYKLLLMNMVLLSFVINVNAQNSMTIESLCLKPGATAVLNIHMTNNVDVCSFQFNVKLPDGVTVVKELNEDDEYVEAIALTSRKKSSHNLTFKNIEDGNYFLLAYSLSNAAFLDSSGVIVTMKVKADEKTPEGKKDVTICNAILVTPNEEKIQLDNTTGYITISQDGDIGNNGSDNGDNTVGDDQNEDSPEIEDNAFYIPTTTLNAGCQQTLIINLKNTNQITAFQFDLKLPEGITVNKMLNDDEQLPAIQLTNRMKSTHRLSCTQLDNGSFRIVAFSMSNQTFRDNDGGIVTVDMTTSSTMPSGSYPIKLSGIHLVPFVNGEQGDRIDQMDYVTDLNVTNAGEEDEVDIRMYISTETLTAGQPDQSIGIAIHNNIDVTAFQFDIIFPQGISIENYVNDDNEIIPNVQLTTRKKSSHSVSCNYRDNGRYSVVVLSSKNHALGGSDGDVLDIKVKVPATLSGNQDVSISNIHIVPLINGQQGIRIDHPDVHHSIYIDNQGGGGIINGSNKIYAETLSMKAGDTAVLNINMSNDDDICSFQFNIKLPKGISIIKEFNEDDEYVESITLSDRKKDSHDLSFKRTDDGEYFIMAYSLSNATFKGKDGSILTLKVKADENMPDNDYEIILDNILMVTPDERKIEQECHYGTITISNEGGIYENNEDEHINVYKIENLIYITGLRNTSYIDIFDLKGIKLFSTICKNDSITINCNEYVNTLLVVSVKTESCVNKIVKIKP